jgi:hypothetical protein
MKEINLLNVLILVGIVHARSLGTHGPVSNPYDASPRFSPYSHLPKPKPYDASPQPKPYNPVPQSKSYAALPQLNTYYDDDDQEGYYDDSDYYEDDYYNRDYYDDAPLFNQLDFLRNLFGRFSADRARGPVIQDLLSILDFSENYSPSLSDSSRWHGGVIRGNKRINHYNIPYNSKPNKPSNNNNISINFIISGWPASPDSLNPIVPHITSYNSYDANKQQSEYNRNNRDQYNNERSRNVNYNYPNMNDNKNYQRSNKYANTNNYVDVNLANPRNDYQNRNYDSNNYNSNYDQRYATRNDESYSCNYKTVPSYNGVRNQNGYEATRNYPNDYNALPYNPPNDHASNPNNDAYASNQGYNRINDASVYEASQRSYYQYNENYQADPKYRDQGNVF